MTASYGGDPDSSPSTGMFTFILARVPLTIAVNNQTKAFGAPLPTPNRSGYRLGEQRARSPLPTRPPQPPTSAVSSYPITATLTASAALDYRSHRDQRHADHHQGRHHGNVDLLNELGCQRGFRAADCYRGFDRRQARDRGLLRAGW